MERLPERFSFGRADDHALVGDWNGDGSDDIAVCRSAELAAQGMQQWEFSWHGLDVPRKLNYLSPFDLPLAGDWNGDGEDDPGGWRPRPSETSASGSSRRMVIPTAISIFRVSELTPIFQWLFAADRVYGESPNSDIRARALAELHALDYRPRHLQKTEFLPLGGTACLGCVAEQQEAESVRVETFMACCLVEDHFSLNFLCLRHTPPFVEVSPSEILRTSICQHRCFLQISGHSCGAI